jgi:hypothetical protein
MKKKDKKIVSKCCNSDFEYIRGGYDGEYIVPVKTLCLKCGKECELKSQSPTDEEYLDNRTDEERKNDSKLKSITTSTDEGCWEKRFDKECCDVWYQQDNGVKHIHWFKDPEKIKDFIHNLLSDQRAEVIKEVLGSIPEEKNIPKKIKMTEEVWQDIIKGFQVKDQGFNQCREEIIEKINKLK